ncbi:MAG: DUF1565 domain-containing protein [Deltaproteobacteria bacterium]|nr:DUF1565 domain-containing protein [Deltaproteobacteria bacterium]
MPAPSHTVRKAPAGALDPRIAVLCALAALTAVALSACDGSAAQDAGAGPDTAVGPEGPAQIPWLADGRPPIAPPGMTPCPPGWREYAEADGVPRCSPYPEAGPADCTAIDEAQFPGTPACARVGPACPADGLPAGLGTDPSVVYVHASASGGGDGSRAAPYRTLREAGAETRPRGTTIALGVGDYNGAMIIPAGVTIVGACVARTSVSLHEGVTAATLTVEGPDVTFRSLGVNGRIHGILVNGPSAALTLDSVVIRNAVGMGLLVNDRADVVATDLVIRNSLTREGNHGRAISAERGATVAVTRGDFTGNHETTVFSVGVTGGVGAHVSLMDVAIRGTLPNSYGISRGAAADLGGRLELRRSYVGEGTSIGVATADADASLLLEDVVIEENGRQGLHILGGDVTATRVDVRHNQLAGITIEAAGDVSFEDLIVSDTRYPAVRQPPQGVGGIYVYSGTVSLVRALISGSAGIGLAAQTTDSVVTAEDLVIRNGVTIADHDERSGLGIECKFGAHLTLTRGLVEANTAVGVIVGTEQPRADFTDVAIIDTRVDDEGYYGYGLSAGREATIVGRRVLIGGSHAIGILAGNRGTSITIDDLVVADVLRQCPDCPVGIGHTSGVAVYGEARVTLSRFEIVRAGLCGLFLADDAQMDLQTGAIRGNEIGACVQIDDYDVNRLNSDVSYDNDTNLDTTTLPVPTVPESLEAVAGGDG